HAARLLGLRLVRYLPGLSVMQACWRLGLSLRIRAERGGLETRLRIRCNGRGWLCRELRPRSLAKEGRQLSRGLIGLCGLRCLASGGQNGRNSLQADGQEQQPKHMKTERDVFLVDEENQAVQSIEEHAQDERPALDLARAQAEKDEQRGRAAADE